MILAFVVLQLHCYIISNTIIAIKLNGISENMAGQSRNFTAFDFECLFSEVSFVTTKAVFCLFVDLYQRLNATMLLELFVSCYFNNLPESRILPAHVT